jgi:hypothetical protein
MENTIPDCPHRLESIVERRRANALCVEVGTPLPRCILKPSTNTAGQKIDAIRWLGSGGSVFVFGACTPNNCPKENNEKEI